MSSAPLKTRLIVAIAAFVVLDLGILAFNFQIARQVEQDAVAINLSGRQRMLSQRITKAGLLATHPESSEATRMAATQELAEAYALFLNTLEAFAQGGETLGGNGHPVRLEAVSGQAALLVGNARGLLADWPRAPETMAGTNAFAHFLGANNLKILGTMNELTSELERQSVAAVSRLRVAQTIAFLLSLANFFLILSEMNRARKNAERLSITDPLTGLMNRAGLYRMLEIEVGKTQSNRSPLAVLLLDLDGFKAVNDTFGHSAGDHTLVEAARRLRDWMLPDWTGGRLGGDEFALVCPGLDHAAAQQAAIDLSAQLGALPGGKLLVSASVGWAVARPGCDADSLIAAADAAMYSQKTGKRISSHRNQQR